MFLYPTYKHFHRNFNGKLKYTTLVSDSSKHFKVSIGKDENYSGRQSHSFANVTKNSTVLF